MDKITTPPFPGKIDPSPCCYSALVYMISRDAYVCRKCGNEYETLSCEKDHILYNGGPPSEVERG